MPTTPFFTQLRDAVQKFLPQPREPDPNEPVTVATLPPVMEAQAEVMRTRLEAEGIPCLFTRDRTYYVDPIQIRVRRSDVDAANALLKEMEDGSGDLDAM